MKNLRGPLFAVLTLITLALTATPAARAADSIPAGAVMFFNLPGCPTGWAPLVSAQGRYLVGLPAGGTLAQGVGTALTTGENRPVGQHKHFYADAGHTLSVGFQSMEAKTDFSSSVKFATTRPGGNNASYTPATTKTGIKIMNEGTTEGTNAPYLQLLVCQKK